MAKSKPSIDTKNPGSSGGSAQEAGTIPATSNDRPLARGGLDVNPDVPHAPIIFFDGAPVFSFMDETVRVTLTAVRANRIGDGLFTEYVTVAYLRCGPEAAKSLRDALDKALLLGTKVEGDAQ